MKMQWCLTLTASLLLAIVVGCTQKQPNGTSGGSPNQPPAAAKANPPSDEECKAFAAALQKAFETEDVAEFQRLIDFDAMIDRAIGDITDAPKSKQGFLEGTRNGFSREGGLVAVVSREIKGGGSYRLLRVHEQDGAKRVLFRLLMSNGGVNYHDFVLAKQTNGSVRAVDFLFYVSGEMVSTTLRQGYLQMAAEESKSFVERLSGTESEFVKCLPELSDMANAVRADDNRKTLAIYKHLPPSVQTHKLVLLYAMTAAMRSDSDEYQSILETFKTAHPDDPCSDFVLLDYYALRKEFGEMAAAALRLDRILGGDAYMRTKAAEALVAADKYDQAREIAQKAIDIEDDYVPAYQALFSASVAAKNYDEAIRTLDLMNKKFENQYTNVPSTPENADFLKSPQYREWTEKNGNAGQSENAGE